jgi:formate dehydrogenase subunit gamma
MTTTQPPAELLRFTPGERMVHRATAILMTICLFTAAILYVDALSQLFGHRALVEWIHVIAGICLPIPILSAWYQRLFAPTPAA